MNLRLKNVKPLWILTVSTLNENPVSALAALRAQLTSASTAFMSTAPSSRASGTGTDTVCDSASGVAADTLAEKSGWREINEIDIEICAGRSRKLPVHTKAETLIVALMPDA